MPGARIAVPVTMPSAIEAIAAGNGATVMRTRSDRRSMMALAEREAGPLQFAGGSGYEVIFPEFQPAFDALYAAAKVMELLAAEHRPLSELVDLLPEWHFANRIVNCPWDRKGQIMRRLLDETNGAKVELTTACASSATAAGCWCSPTHPSRPSTSTPKDAPTATPTAWSTRPPTASNSSR